MALQSRCFSSSPQVCVSLKIDRPRFPPTQLVAQQVKVMEKKNQFSFLGGSKNIFIRNFEINTMSRRRYSSAVYASWLPSSDIASTAFTLGTAAVIPFYTFMIVAPKAHITKKLVESSIPYIVLGILYSYLLYLSWRPDTFRLMFASEYWLPELSGIAKLFSSEMNLACAWIHLLAVDLFAARQVYYEGLRDDIETRHSVSLCLLFCPIGILAHSITKAITKRKV